MKVYLLCVMYIYILRSVHSDQSRHSVGCGGCVHRKLPMEKRLVVHQSSNKSLEFGLELNVYDTSYQLFVFVTQLILRFFSYSAVMGTLTTVVT